MRKDIKIAVISASVVAVGIVAYYGFRKNGWFRKKNNKKDSGNKNDADVLKNPPVDNTPTVYTPPVNQPPVNPPAATLKECPYPIQIGSRCSQVKRIQQMAIQKGLGDKEFVLSSGQKRTLNNSGGADGVLGNTTIALIKSILKLWTFPKSLTKDDYDKVMSELIFGGFL